MFTTAARFAVTGVKGPALSVTPVRAVLVRWAAAPDVWRLRYRLKGGAWTSVRVKTCEKVLAPLEPGVWQFAVAPVGGSWLPAVEITL